MERIDRRQMIVGGAALILAPGCASVPDGGRSLLAPVTIALRVFIPSPLVTFGYAGLNRSFNGGDKATLTATIDPAISGSSSFRRTFREFGETKEYDTSFSRPVPQKPAWYTQLAAGAQPISTAREPVTDETLNASWQVPAGASHGAFLKVEGSNPLVVAAPAIDAEILVGLRRTSAGVEYSIVAAHDGFPSYELKLNQTIVYTYDCVGKGDPSNLFPPMDVSKTLGWTTL